MNFLLYTGKLGARSFVDGVSPIRENIKCPKGLRSLGSVKFSWLRVWGVGFLARQTKKSWEVHAGGIGDPDLVLGLPRFASNPLTSALVFFIQKTIQCRML